MRTKTEKGFLKYMTGNSTLEVIGNFDNEYGEKYYIYKYLPPMNQEKFSDLSMDLPDLVFTDFIKRYK